MEAVQEAEEEEEEEEVGKDRGTHSMILNPRNTLSSFSSSPSFLPALATHCRRRSESGGAGKEAKPGKAACCCCCFSSTWLLLMYCPPFPPSLPPNKLILKAVATFPSSQGAEGGLTFFSSSSPFGSTHGQEEGRGGMHGSGTKREGDEGEEEEEVEVKVEEGSVAPATLSLERS